MNLDRTLVVQLCEGAVLLFAIIAIIAVPIVGQWRRMTQKRSAQQTA